jgi:hypothetical protein
MGFMTSYSFNPPLMKGWVTHGLDFYCELFPDCRSKPTSWWQLNASLAAWDRWNIPSLYSGLPTGYSDKATETGVFVRGVGLAMGWEAALERIFTTQIQPNMGPDKALRGVFIGDELCCGPTPATVRAVPGRLSAISVFLLKSILYGAFVWAHRTLNDPKRRFPARAVLGRWIRSADAQAAGSAGSGHDHLHERVRGGV